MKIIQKLLTINHRKGRTYNNKKYKIVGICNHISVGLRGSVTNWFNNPKSQASYQYLVCKNGDTIQFVRDEDTAWSQGVVNRPTAKIYFDNGRVNPNWYLLSISHEVVSTEPLTEEQYKSSLWLHNLLINKYNIPITREFIIGHYELDSVNRPNDPQKSFPWDRLINDLVKLNKKEEIDMYKDKEIIAKWALAKVEKANELGLMVGDDKGNFNPKGEVTREQLAVALVNLYNKLKS